MEKITYPNGIRILLEQCDYAKTATVALFIKAGSRYESLEQWGLAHFVEHMLFKGTAKRSSLDIAQQTDMIGGQMNAYTTKEYTCVYIRTLSEYDTEGLDIIGDIVINPKIASEDMEIERGVILEEIAMYEDSPEDLAGDGIYEAVWGDDPLGRTIIGLPECISTTTTEKIRNFHSSFYRSNQMVLAISGKYNREKILEKASELFSHLPDGAPNFKMPPAPTWHPKNIWVKNKDTQQVHIVLGFPSPSLEDKSNVSLAILNSIIGGGASSRLFQRIREELGLAYSIYSYQSPHVGCGCFSISAGISPESQEEALTEIMKVVKGFEGGVTADEFLRAKNQIRASIAMSYENTYNFAMGIGRREIFGMDYKSEEQLMSELEAVTHQNVNDALHILKGPVCLSAAGKTKPDSFYKDFIQSV